MNNVTELIEMDVADIIMEKPHAFSIGSRQFYLYPVTLGKSYLLQRCLEALKIDRQQLKENPFIEALRLSKEKCTEVCRILVYHTLNTVAEIFDEKLIETRIRYFEKNLSCEDMAQLLVITLSTQDISKITKQIGIDSERKRYEKVSRAKKKDSNTFIFGGISIFGSLIGPACEKLNLTPHQVVWDISYQFLQLLMMDSISQVYLTDEERKRCRLSNDREIINADNPENIKKINSMNWD